MEYMARGFVIMLIISMPCVLVAAGIGLVVGILQAVTQVQEQTIAAAPKILAVFLVLIIGGVGFVRLLTNFTTDGMALAFNLVSKNDTYVLPADYYKYTKPFAGEMSDKFENTKDFKDIMKNKGKGSFLEKDQSMKYFHAPKSQTPKPNLVEQYKILGK